MSGEDSLVEFNQQFVKFSTKAENETKKKFLNSVQNQIGKKNLQSRHKMKNKKDHITIINFKNLYV